MKGTSPVAAGLFLLLGAAGLLGLTGRTEVQAQAHTVSAWMLRQQLGPRGAASSPAPSAPPSPAPVPSHSAGPVPVETVSEAWDERDRQSQTEETTSPDSVQVEPDVSLELRNNTEFDIDFTALPALPKGLDFASEDPVILIVHTHTTESYYVEGEDPAEAVYRSRDEDDGVMAVGDAMAEALEARGYPVLHDKTLCDYPEYSGAYNRSREVIEADLADNPSICLVLDVHRDAVSDGDGGQLRMAAQVDGQELAQVMLVVGTDEGGLEHPEWRQNLSLAAVLQTALARTSPGMMRPINLRSERFNQDLGALGLLVEVGASGNTLEEALAAAERFSGGLADVLDRYSGKSS